MDSILLTMCLAAIMFQIGTCERRCKADTECEDLGELSCIKTACEEGLCGCRRGYASRFVGHEFKCVKIKRVGEDCSSGTDGACGAANSQCVDGKCTCISGFASHGGQVCSGGDVGPGESTNDDSLGTCQLSTRENDAPGTCICAAGYMVVISNDYSINYAFTGGKYPNCRQIRVGEFCLDDADCSGITGGGAVCTNNACACTTVTDVVDISGSVCGAGLAIGAACGGVTGVCRGSEGLTCGDVCDSTNAGKCVCDPGWSGGATGTCAKKAVGDTCHGDGNCKSINDLAVCVDGFCEESSAVTASASLLLLSVVIIIQLL